MSDAGFDGNTLKFGEEKGVVEVQVEECGVEIFRDRMPFSSSDERIKEMSIDRLSELPDSILIHILSFLGMRKAGITSVLSKRWKFLWAKLPTLEFRDDCFSGTETEKKLGFVSWVNRALDIRDSRDYLEKFLVKFNFYTKRLASDVDSWIECSVKNEVKQLSLMLFTFGNNNYVLPQVIYSCSSLVSLHFIGCIMANERTIEWKSLTDLTLYTVMLKQHLLDEIISSCTVLKSLDLEECWGFNRLVIDSRCLERLAIEEPESEPFLEISAPYISRLNITVFPHERKWQLKSISSVVSASIDFFEFDCECSEEVMRNAKEFLENFQHVNDLYVKQRCFEILSTMAVNGWQLPLFKLRDMTITSCSEYEHAISGIICLLESSPNLETLLLQGYETDGEIFDLDPTAKDDLDNDLMHLRTIKIENFADPNGEPLLTLARILLRQAPALEEMAIVIDVEDTNDFVKIGQTLLTYPRSSTKAKIHLFSRNL